ncbi:MAG TPA: DUF4254 domain-containing protein [Sphingobacterium sp.]|nr:DUF4254 domain-containing protein [Sphingobacterium sp.]
MLSEKANKIFEKAIEVYHIKDNIYQNYDNPYPPNSLERLLYKKAWIDTVQWHIEDEIRNPKVTPEQALKWKREIDKSNQDRTDTVERIDSYFLEKYNEIKPQPSARINTESPAWAIDRLSILALKIYHMRLEANRKDSDKEQRKKCSFKLDILLEQQRDLSQSIDELLEDIEHGTRYMKVYRQMKMYNDPKLNPVLYAQDDEKK